MRPFTAQEMEAISRSANTILETAIGGLNSNQDRKRELFTLVIAAARGVALSVHRSGEDAATAIQTALILFGGEYEASLRDFRQAEGESVNGK